MRATWGILAGVLVTAAPAFGQSTNGAARREINLSASGRLEYDSNVLRTNASTSALYGPNKDDIRATPSLDFNILLPVGRQSFFLDGSLGYDFYKRFDQFNRERINVSGGANLSVLSGCNTKVTGDFSRQQSSLTDVLSPISLDNTENRTSLGARLDCPSTIGISPSVGISHNVVKNSLSILEVSDYRTDTVDVSLGYARPTLGRVSIYGTYTNSTYPNRVFGPTAQVDGIESYASGLRFEREIGSRITGTISIGYSAVNPKLTRSGRFRGASYSANVSLRPTENFSLVLIASRAAELSNQLNVNYSITDSYSLSGDYRFSQFLSANFGASYQKRDFKGSSLLPSPLLTLNNDDVTSAFIGLRYQWSKRVTLSVDFTQEKRESDNPFLNYKSSRIGFSGSLGF